MIDTVKLDSCVGMRKMGMTLQQIGDRLGISRQRVGEILKLRYFKGIK